MPMFCGNCGGKLEEGQQFCSGCGQKVNTDINTVLSKTNKPVGNYGTYKMIVGIIMILICFCLLSAGMQSYEDEAMLVFTLPGILGMVAAIMTICSRSNKKLFKPAGIIFIVSAVVNFFGIFDISIYAILGILFGILNIVYSNKSN